MNTHSKQSEPTNLREALADVKFNEEPGIMGDLGANMEPAYYDKLLEFIEAYAQQEVNKVLSELKEKVEGFKTDRDATRKHIESFKLPSDEEAQRLLDMEIEADDRDDTLNDAISAIESYMKGDLK